jgi:hypothetical protein
MTHKADDLWNSFHTLTRTQLLNKEVNFRLGHHEKSSRWIIDSFSTTLHHSTSISMHFHGCLINKREEKCRGNCGEEEVLGESI